MDDKERYYKLRWLMSGNVQETWSKVEELGAIAVYTSWEDFDNYLDSLDPVPYCKFMCGKYDYEGK